jgi:hypothetical protein
MEIMMTSTASCEAAPGDHDDVHDELHWWWSCEQEHNDISACLTCCDIVIGLTSAILLVVT